MANRMEAMKAKAAAAGKAKETAKATAAYKASMGPDAAKARKSQAEVNKQVAQTNKQAAMKAAQQAKRNPASADSPYKPYTDQLNSVIQAKKAAPARSTGLGAAVRGGAPAPRVGGMGGGMGSMAGRGGMGARPAMTPQVKQGLQSMSDKLRGMPMKRGGATKAKKK